MTTNAKGRGAASHLIAAAWATVTRGPYVTSRASFVNYGDQLGLLRDDTIRALDQVFPLAVYLDPIPPFPFVREPGLLSDPNRPLVFYADTRPGPIY